MARILVVDDDAPVRDSVAAILEAEGHDIATAAGGREALDEVERCLPDLIVLDLAMPEMSGWQVLEELHARELRARTRVLLMSGQFDSSEVAQRAPSDRFLPKPFDVDLLVRVVTDLLAVPPADLYVRHDRSATLARLIRRVDQILD